jgi:hypothetical protein
MSKLPLLRERHFYNEPKKPKPGAKRSRIEAVATTSQRVNHWPGYGNAEDECYDDDEQNDEEETSGSSRMSISLIEINERVAKEGLDPKKVFFTASFSEDYLCLEVIHVHKMSAKEIQEEYESDLAIWNEGQEAERQRQIEQTNREMERLKEKAEKLKAKKK